MLYGLVLFTNWHFIILFWWTRTNCYRDYRFHCTTNPNITQNYMSQCALLDSTGPWVHHWMTPGLKCRTTKGCTDFKLGLSSFLLSCCTINMSTQCAEENTLGPQQPMEKGMVFSHPIYGFFWPKKIKVVGYHGILNTSSNGASNEFLRLFTRALWLLFLAGNWLSDLPGTQPVLCQLSGDPQGFNIAPET